MKKSRRVIKKKSRKTHKKNRGGDCGCNKPKLDQLFIGGYGAASYQGGIDNNILPLNKGISSAGDPSAVANISSERFTKFEGGKKKRRGKKSRGGFSADFLLGESASTNPVLGFGTSAGGVNIVKSLTGKT